MRSTFQLIQYPVLLASLSALIGISGCGRAAPELEPISGVVAYQGQPVPEAVVLFQNPDLGTYLTATAGADGIYRVATINGEGLPTGSYQVAVSPPEIKIETGKPPPPPRAFPQIPLRYRTPQTSGLTLVVEQGGNRFDINMRP